MKRLFGIFLSAAMLMGMTGIACADKKDAEKNAAMPSTPPALSVQDQQKQLVMSSLQTMQNEEVRVLVLQQLINREVGDLRQMQAVFCDQYKLDIEKWRKGLYRYDDKSAKFVEVPDQTQSKA